DRFRVGELSLGAPCERVHAEEVFFGRRPQELPQRVDGVRAEAARRRADRLQTTFERRALHDARLPPGGQAAGATPSGFFEPTTLCFCVVCTSTAPLAASGSDATSAALRPTMPRSPAKLRTPLISGWLGSPTITTRYPSREARSASICGRRT